MGREGERGKRDFGGKIFMPEGQVPLTAVVNDDAACWRTCGHWSALVDSSQWTFKKRHLSRIEEGHLTIITYFTLI